MRCPRYTIHFLRFDYRVYADRSRTPRTQPNKIPFEIDDRIGTALLEKVIEETKRRGIRTIYVYTEINSSVEKILSKHGFKKVGFYKNRYKENRDANILELRTKK